MPVNTPANLRYISAYPASLQEQVQQLIDDNALGGFLLTRYPTPHAIANDKDLRTYVLDIKQQYLKKSDPLSKIVYDNKIHVVNNALGLHTYLSRVQGGKLKSKNEIRISTVFKQAPEAFLQMIAVHELAHLKEKDHNKGFYKLCQHMLADYFQLEFDTRLYLIQLETFGAIY
ncbi:MAG: putative metal-dependent hydrolase [Candidatus Azotimanducaceae bacterium]|jgi:predicted metal-dependent hydrolase